MFTFKVSKCFSNNGNPSKMGFRMNYLFIVCLLAAIYRSNGCTMEGVTTWQLPINVQIEDYFDGIVLQRGLNDIGGFNLISTSDLNGGPYIVAAIENSAFVLRTNEAYRLYEENETVDTISLTYAFTCTNGQTPSSPLTISIEINDNNNNIPLFKTPDDTTGSLDTTYEFTIATPVPPGFTITNCVSDIIVRDIDLTTYRIDFGIEDNPYIAIEYDEADSTVAKEFKAVLRSTTFIRSIPEPIILTISATDVDLTGDPSITTTTTVTIHGSSEFEMPLEPVFSQAFYLASYTEDNQVTMEQTISLQQGYDELVDFNLEGDYADAHFDITTNGNQVTLSVTSPLPTTALQAGQIHLVVNAAREFTSGASATIIVQLPEEVHLEFEQPHYMGQIVDNTLQLTQLILSQGSQGSGVTASIEDHSQFFTATVTGNIITLSMTALDDNIIQENNVINLRVHASTVSRSATTIVTLEIVKDDIVTPVFDQPLYTGTYNPATGLTVGSFVLVQGFDETVDVSLSGEYASYFELVRDGASSTLSVTSLPSDILAESHALLSLEATKPRTVGASAVVSIALPGAREMQFESQSYRGSIQDNVLTLDPLVLSVGYDDDVSYSLSGDYSASFELRSVQNQVEIFLVGQLPQEIVLANNFLMLTVTAEGLFALRTSTAVLLEIIKTDATTPVFSQTIYYGTHLASGVDIGSISLSQGFDNSVNFRIQGENSEYFSITTNQNSVTLNVQSSIPEDIIFQEKALVFNIFADKPLTVGANAAIVIKFSEDFTEPTVMQFARNTYVGSLENSELTLESIVLETGFAVGTEFLLYGDYSGSFTPTVTNNIVTLSLTSDLPAGVSENNKFIVLELEARRDRAVSVVTGIVLELVQEEIEITVFNQAYYSGIYTEENTLLFQDTISLTQGFDETVTFGLEGESSAWFAVAQNGNSATVVSTSVLPPEILESHHQLLFTVVAYKSNSINGHAAISIELPKNILEQEVLRFTQSSYEGQLDGSILQVPTITLSNELTDNVEVSHSGAYAAYFTVSRDSNTIHIGLLNELPSEVIDNNDFIVLDITASKEDAVSGYTALILNIVKEPIIVTPVFEEAFYTGEISEQNGLLFEHTIRLIQGFDESVSFSIDGDGAERFILTQTGQNSFSISVAQGGLGDLGNNGHFVFSVVASKAGSGSGHAAIVIYNADSSAARTLRFSQNHYRGALEQNDIVIESIIVAEGYSSEVELTLSGDYVEYFQLAGQDGTYTMQLVSNIPDEIINENNVLVYSLEAIIGNTRTHATVIVELIKDNIGETEALAFDEAYYVSSYSAASGVMTDVQLRVVSGNVSDIVFSLDGGNAAWFNVEHSESIVTISLVSPLPAELFIDNQPIIFTISAINSGGHTATATIVVTLEGELSELTILGFERNNYIGTIESGSSTLESITLTQGFSSEVSFTLQGDLNNYFSITQQGPTVNVVLQSGIPEQAVPENRIVVLDLLATASQAVSAAATIVFEVVADRKLAFSAGHYIGEYSEDGGLVFDSIISLDEGYGEDVQFTLEGDHSQWFSLQTVQGNVMILALSEDIPSVILANNHQLVFRVIAQTSNSNMASATIVISLLDDKKDPTILGFERASYVGSIENDELSLEPIILSVGYTDAVTFELQGDLASYFNLERQGYTVNIQLQSAIPEQALPANGILLLEVRASAPEAVPATTTVVFATNQIDGVEELAFSAAYYVGEYSEAGGLIFEAISLDTGYDTSVQFALEGEHSQWFTLVVQGNTVTLTTTGAIPPAILVNNRQLVFSITAQKLNSNIVRAAIIISLLDDYIDAAILGFERASYLGSIADNALIIEPIVLTEGYTHNVTFSLDGALSSYFYFMQQDSTITMVLQNAIPEETLPANGILILELTASAPQSIPAMTTVIIEAQRLTAEELIFSAAHYTGEYSETGGLAFDTTISLDVGYDTSVQFALEGEQAQWFDLVVQGNTVTLTTAGAIPPAILASNHQLVFSVTAQKLSSNTARTTVVISLVDDYTDAVILGFERTSYLGSIENDDLSIEQIVLMEGYTDDVTFELYGNLNSYFIIQQQGSTVNVVLQTAVPEQSLPSNGIIILELRASAPQAVPAVTTIVIKAQQAMAVDELAFSAAYYIGQYNETEGLNFDNTISLAMGYDQTVEFALDGDHAQWFALEGQGNAVSLIISGAIPPAILVSNHQLVFSVTGQKSNSIRATATVVISLVDDFTNAVALGFERTSYLGSIENDALSLEPIVLSEGYSDEVVFTIYGDLVSYFNLELHGSTVHLILQSVIPVETLPANGIVLLDLRASAPEAVPATTTIIVETQRATVVDELAFSAAYYTGEYSETGGLVFTDMSLAVGYDQYVEYDLEGEFAEWFIISDNGNVITLHLFEPIPPAELVNIRKMVMIMKAVKPGNSATTVVIVSVIENSGSETNEAFDKVLYEGTINLNFVQHETITITGYAEGSVEIHGVYRELFSATVSGGRVVIGAAGTLSLPDGVSHVALELHAGSASAVLILVVIESETPELPTVVFGSPSYVLRTVMSQTGLLGQVQATSSNGESIAYSLAVSDVHLGERISINSDGEIHLSAPTNTGVYSFEVIATSTITQVQATASVQLTVEAAAICGDDHALPPLIILDRNEEVPHMNLVVLDSETQAGCQFRLTNRWPLDQDWLYVDDTGLHARTIDREDPRIAFMALSQVQVELILECASDTKTRVKRSTVNPRLDWLGPYEYGSNKWILTDTILYNSRRSFVNLIVNDINDNYPIFVGQNDQPIVCGYPVPELEEIVLPRALAELKATDADVGENAALRFWSSSELLAVAPTTGFVHVRDGESLSHDQQLTVSVTDLYGRDDGLTATVTLMVKLLDTSHIAVVTVRNAFLDQEETILANISSAVGYEVKVLSSAVISDDPADSENARHKREVTTEGASLQLYVYGLIEREPVTVDQLTNDITEIVLAGVDVTSTISLEDYLEGRQIYGPGGRDTGLLVATIVLSVLLFILMLLIALWFFLRWRKARNYDQFSDATSLDSQSEHVETPPKVDSLRKPRLNIDELKRSERRLQEMLDAPINEEAPKAQTSQAEPETVINMALTKTADIPLPLVIQSIDKLKDDENSGEEDEFGEKKQKGRRKSVVTFNENVEKIIHVQDIPDDNSSDVEIFKL